MSFFCLGTSWGGEDASCACDECRELPPPSAPRTSILLCTTLDNTLILLNFTNRASRSPKNGTGMRTRLLDRHRRTSNNSLPFPSPREVRIVRPTLCSISHRTYAAMALLAPIYHRLSSTIRAVPTNFPTRICNNTFGYFRLARLARSSQIWPLPPRALSLLSRAS